MWEKLLPRAVRPVVDIFQGKWSPVSPLIATPVPRLQRLERTCQVIPRAACYLDTGPWATVELPYTDGFAISRVEEGLYYWVVASRHPGSWDAESDQPGGFSFLHNELRDKEQMLFFINRSKFGTWGRYPFTLSIRDPQ